MVPFVPLAAAQAAGGLYNTIDGIIENARARRALRELAKTPRPEYTIGPETAASYATAQNRAQYGFSPEQRNQFEQNLQRQNLAALRQAGRYGATSAALSGLNALNAQAMNTYAAQDASQQAQNVRYAAGRGDAMQQQRNMILTNQIRHRDMLEQALGQAARDARYNISNGVRGLAYAASPYANQLMAGKAAQTPMPEQETPQENLMEGGSENGEEMQGLNDYGYGTPAYPYNYSRGLINQTLRSIPPASNYR